MGFITIASLVSAAPYELVRINNTCKHIELCVLLIASMLVTYMKQYNYMYTRKNPSFGRGAWGKVCRGL